MNNLHIKTPDNIISINLIDNSISISIDPDCAAPVALTTPDLEWSDTLLEGEPVNYDDAEKAVAVLGPGWRLPTRRELASIIDMSRHAPAIDIDRFPDTQSKWYWTSTPCAWNESARWVVAFNLGLVHDLRRYDYACVRAVRAGQ